MAVVLTGVIVDLAELGETVVASLIAGVGMTALFSLVIFGVARSEDMRREERPAAAVAFGALATVAMLASVAGIAAGLAVMLAS